MPLLGDVRREGALSYICRTVALFCKTQETTVLQNNIKTVFLQHHFFVLPCLLRVAAQDGRGPVQRLPPEGTVYCRPGQNLVQR